MGSTRPRAYVRDVVVVHDVWWKPGFAGMPRSRVIVYFSLELPSRQSLIIRDFTRTHDDDGSNDDRRAAPGAHSGSPRRRVEVCATSPFIGLSVSNHSPRPLSSPLPLSANDDRYEMRRECQEILPGLILGPLQAAKSLDILQGLGVTHMCVLSPPPPPFNSRSG